MNNIIRTSVTAIALLLTVSAAQAKGTSLAYSRTANAQIGITAGNQVTVGSIYKITDASGKVVFQGRIKSRNTFYIPTNKLANGSYTFSVDGYQLQDFSLNN
jgi:uridine phosphorylase